MKTRQEYLKITNRLVQELYKNKKYYVKIPSTSKKFEKNYWNITVDPDGKKRDRPKELKNNFSDYDYIINFLKKKNLKIF